MRQPQQNKRMRGRGRKPANSGNRVHESNGPDVKIRGNASHIAEKYVTLARDAQVAGDRIVAENYLQHAEHYFRIVAATQNQQSQTSQPNVSQSENDTESAAKDDGGGNAQRSRQDSGSSPRGQGNGAEGQQKEEDGDRQAKTRGRRRRKPESAEVPEKTDSDEKSVKSTDRSDTTGSDNKSDPDVDSGDGNARGIVNTEATGGVKAKKRKEKVPCTAEEKAEAKSIPGSDESVEMA
ncbi:MAG: DUF4167 domain-containing protein [Fimbriimonadaceae bacterium]|nr:DUF4167 domain-containing protein [Alphaproteobacteria bacterium]